MIWDTEKKVPVNLQSLLVNPGIPLPEEITELTGITQEQLDLFGISLEEALKILNYICIKAAPKYLVAHNALGFDKLLLEAEVKRLGKDFPNLMNIPWIDTRQDLPFKKEPESRRLKHLALDIEVINHFPHRALFDSLVMLKVMSQFPMEEIITYQKIPIVTLRALVSFDDRDKAKVLRYSWEKLGEKVYPKMWCKLVKEHLIPMEIEAAKKLGFQVVRL